MKWVRLWTDEVIKGTTFTELNLAERGLWWSLLLLAGDSMTPGIVELRKGVKYPHETLAILVNCDRKTLRNGIKKLLSVGKISHLDDGRIKINKWDKYQTRYEKYYKNKDSEEKEKQENSAENNGIDMQGREEEEKKKIKKDIQIPLRTGTYSLTEDKIKTYQKTYPSIDVMQCLRECRQWNEDNPGKRKTKAGILRHINTWLQRQQERKGYVARAPDYEDNTNEMRELEKQFTPEQRAENIKRVASLVNRIGRIG